jgi:translation initiation factor 2B subunit (eIF-2B alpha/beta/delta family)
VRDVLEQYSHGHINMMMRIKELQRKYVKSNRRASFTFMIVSRRIEQTIGKHTPIMGEDRSKATVLSRIQRVENHMIGMGRSIDDIHQTLKTMDDKFDRLMNEMTRASHSTRAARMPTSTPPAKFIAIDEEIS